MVFPVKLRMIEEMTRGDKGKLFSLFVPLFTLPTQQDCVLPVATDKLKLNDSSVLDSVDKC